MGDLRFLAAVLRDLWQAAKFSVAFCRMARYNEKDKKRGERSSMTTMIPWSLPTFPNAQLMGEFSILF